MKRLLVLLLAGLLFCPVVATAAPVQWGVNGHWYQFIEGNLSWTAANAAAQALSPSPSGTSWTLATLTSQAENDFVAALPTVPYDAWIGGFQPTQAQTNPAVGWQWVTTEVWGFTNWGSVEPNDDGPPGPNIPPGVERNLENYLGLANGLYTYTGQWHDAANSHIGNTGYIAEAVPIPAAVWLLGSGLVGLVALKRKFRP